MAKPRKPKNEEPKPENSGDVVRHQKLCLSIDLDSRRIYGYTELEVVVPDIGIIGLHAENLGIANVLVDGEPTVFEYYPHSQCMDNERRWSSITSPGSAADIATSMYLSALERELEPNLLINCYKAFKAENELQEQLHMENGSHSSGEPKQNVKSVRIDYWVEKAETGIHFDNNVLHTDNQIRRARCWFPCIDEYSQRCCYDLEFTVARDLVAVSTGNLLYQVLSKDDPPRKTYVYRLDVPVSAWWISLVVAPFEILPDHQNSVISHMCLPANIFKLQNTVGFFHGAFSHYEDYLGAKFPFGAYKQVFISPEMAVSPVCLGASLSIFSSQILYDEKVIDKTIDTRIKLAHALARQWFGVYIAPASPDDEWLLDGLAGFLTDSFIKKYLGNNEARYRRFKANCAVCKADDSGATTLSSTASTKDLYGTQSIGLYGKIRSWKSVAILQMLEKQMGPESFCKILQTIVSRSLEAGQSSRTLSTKEFRHFANKVGNLERPFLKEFFPRWIGSCGCPILRMGFSYNKRKNIVELAALRDCTASQSMDALPIANADSGNGESDAGWPGMMSIRVNELDGMYDHPILPMAGDNWQLLEIQCHSKLASRRFQKPKKGLKADGSDDNGDAGLDSRSSSESPLLWIRADPEMEYLAEIQFNQPVQMWINQLEKDKDVVAQSQAIRMLETLPQISFSVVNALTYFLRDIKAFWRVRIEAAFALANSSSEETDWSGLLQLVKFFKLRRFDSDVGLPKPNDFRDIPEYFVLEAIPRAVAMVRSSDGKSPREAVEFVSQLLKYNDNNGNVYSDVFWLAALVQSIGEFEFGQQSILLLPSLLKRIDRLLQFDRLMPSYNGTLTVSCIHTLTQIALKLSAFIPLDRVSELVQGFKDLSTVWQVRVEASRALLDLEFQYKGLEAALSLFMKYLEEEQSLRGQVKLAVHAMRLCQMYQTSESKDDIKSITLVALLRLFEGRMAYNNVYLRHYLFCILQIFSGRPPTLYGAPRDKTLHLGDGETCTEQKNIFAPFVAETKPVEAPVEITHCTEQENIFAPFVTETKPVEAPVEITHISDDHLAVPDVPKEVDTVSSSHEKRMPVFKIKVRHSGATSKGDETENQSVEKSRGVRNEPDRGASSSVSVDAPHRNYTDVSLSNQHIEEVNSCHDRGSRVTTGIGSAKLAGEGDDLGKELQCTADSSKVLTQTQFHYSSLHDIDGDGHIIKDVVKSTSLETHSAVRYNHDDGSMARKESSIGKEKKNGKDKKRRREDHKAHKDDPEYLERKRLKKEKKRKEKKLSKLLNEQKSSLVLPRKKEETIMKEPEKMLVNAQTKPNEVANSDLLTRKTDVKPETSGVGAAPKFRIKIKNRTLSKP